MGIELGTSRTQKAPTDKGTIGELIWKKAGKKLSLKIIASVSYF